MLILNFSLFISSQQACNCGITVLILGSVEAEEMILNNDSGKCNREDL